MRFTKWGGKKHWTYEMEPIGSDSWGTWFGAREGIMLQRGEEEPVVQSHDFVQLIPSDGWYVAAFNADGPSTLDLYVDITDRPVITGDVVTAVDLDLDVLRVRADGRVLLDDEDEFEEHQILYGYPPEIIAGARASADRLLAAVKAGEEPFNEVGRQWLARYSALNGG
jgi:protein associated with RNAse G/E